MFYLANEGEAPGKGANTVVSYVHHYLKHYGLGEQRANFHFDNCTGQNKNNTVLWYTMWRVITGNYTHVTYFLVEISFKPFVAYACLFSSTIRREFVE